MKLLQELNKSTEKSSTSERQRARIYAAVQKLLDKEFSGNDALATDLLSGMMDFYDGHLHLATKSTKSTANARQDVEDALRQLLPRGAAIEVKPNGNSFDVSLGARLQASGIKNGKKWALVVMGYKRDIPIDDFDSLEDVAEVIKDINRQGKKWFVENDPDGDQW